MSNHAREKSKILIRVARMRMAKAQVTIIRKKKGKYIDPKGLGPKKDPVKTIALVVLPTQRPFHKYLSEELRVILCYI